MENLNSTLVREIYARYINKNVRCTQFLKTQLFKEE